MSGPGRAELKRADGESDPTRRRLWLVAAIGAIVERPIFLVGGSAVDLHTGSYRPTDIDLVGVVSRRDREALVAAGFVDRGGRHLRWEYSNGDVELVEFPESVLDGDFERIRLSDTVAVNVITAESLVVDRIHQATDGSTATFDGAIQLIIAVAHRVDWAMIAADLRGRPEAGYLGSVEKARELLAVAGLSELRDMHFRKSRRAE